MNDSMPPELIKKVTGLRNLREALSLVRKEIERQNKLRKDAKIIQMRPQNPVPAQAHQAKPRLEHLGRNMTKRGIITHIRGVRGSDMPHYEISVNMHKMGKAPHISVSHVGSNGSLVNKNPTTFSNLDEAIQSVSRHHGSGEW